MKVFEFKWKDDNDLVVAPNREEAIECYKNFAGNNLEGCHVNECSESKWKDYYFTDANEMEPDLGDFDYEVDYPNGHDEDEYMNGYKIIETLEEYMKRQTRTHVIE